MGSESIFRQFILTGKCFSGGGGVLGFSFVRLRKQQQRARQVGVEHENRTLRTGGKKILKEAFLLSFNMEIGRPQKKRNYQGKRTNTSLRIGGRGGRPHTSTPPPMICVVLANSFGFFRTPSNHILFSLLEVI